MVKKKIDKNLAIAALLLNIFVLPGLGTIIGRRTNEGIGQLILFLVGLPLSLVLVGIVLVLIAWVWGIWSGIKLIKESK